MSGLRRKASNSYFFVSKQKQAHIFADFRNSPCVHSVHPGHWKQFLVQAITASIIRQMNLRTHSVLIENKLDYV